MTTDSPAYRRLISPHGFDGRGPVPPEVTAAARQIARLRVKFVSQWMPGADSPLTTREVEELFDAAALQAEWMRELYEAVHTVPVTDNPGSRSAGPALAPSTSRGGPHDPYSR